MPSVLENMQLSTVTSTHSMKVLDSTIFLGPPCVEFMFGGFFLGTLAWIDGYETIQITKKLPDESEHVSCWFDYSKHRNAKLQMDCVTKGPDVWCRFIYSAHLIRLLVQFSAAPSSTLSSSTSELLKYRKSSMSQSAQLSWQPPWHCPLNSLHQPPLQWSHRPALSCSFYSLIKFLFTVKVVVGQTCCCGTTVTPTVGQKSI